jgi:hypothetical protein
MDIKGTIRFTEEGLVLKPYGGEQELWNKSNLVDESYIVIDGFKYKPSNIKEKKVTYQEESDEEEE